MKYTKEQKERIKKNEIKSLKFPNVEEKDGFFIVESKINTIKNEYKQRIKSNVF